MAGRDLCPQGQNPDQPGHPSRTSFVGNKAVVPRAREFSYRRGRVHPKDVSATTFGFKLQNCSNCLSKDMPSDSSHKAKPKPPDLDGPKVPSVFKLSESQALPHGQQHFLPLSELSHQYNFPRATCFHLGPRLSLSPGTEAIVVLTVATIQVPGSAQTSAPLVSGTCPQPSPGHPPQGLVLGDPAPCEWGFHASGGRRPPKRGVCPCGAAEQTLLCPSILSAHSHTVLPCRGPGRDGGHCRARGQGAATRNLLYPHEGWYACQKCPGAKPTWDTSKRCGTADEQTPLPRVTPVLAHLNLSLHLPFGNTQAMEAEDNRMS